MYIPTPTPTESAATLRAAVAAELEAAQTKASALTRLTEAKARYIEACCEPGKRFLDAEQAHSAARRAHLAAIAQVKNAEAWVEYHAKEAACPWTGATPAAPQL